LTITQKSCGNKLIVATAVFPASIIHPLTGGECVPFHAGLLTCAFLAFARILHCLPGKYSQWLTFIFVRHTSNAYSGGTVRDLHPIPFSPPKTRTPVETHENFQFLAFKLYQPNRLMSSAFPLILPGDLLILQERNENLPAIPTALC